MTAVVMFATGVVVAGIGFGLAIMVCLFLWDYYL